MKQSVLDHKKRLKEIQEVFVRHHMFSAEEVMEQMGLSYSTHRYLMQNDERYKKAIQYARTDKGAKVILERMKKKRFRITTNKPVDSIRVYTQQEVDLSIATLSDLHKKDIRKVKRTFKRLATICTIMGIILGVLGIHLAVY